MENSTTSAPAKQSNIGALVITSILTAFVTFFVKQPFEKASTSDAELIQTIKLHGEQIENLRRGEVRSDERFNQLNTSIGELKATQKEMLDELRRKK